MRFTAEEVNRFFFSVIIQNKKIIAWSKMPLNEALRAIKIMINIQESRKNKRLILKEDESWRLHHWLWDFFSSAMSLWLTVLLFGFLFGINIGAIPSGILGVLILSVLISFALYFPPGKMSVYYLKDRDYFREKMAKELNSMGWSIVHNNQNYIYAKLKYDWRDLTYYVAIFSKDKVLVKSTFAIPFFLPLNIFISIWLGVSTLNKALHSDA